MLLYALAVIVRFQRTGYQVDGPGNNRRRIFGVLWTGAWILCVVHVICAYHFQHHWSQAAARQHTAEMTDRVVGWYWSGGLYVNYAFLAVWGGHCILWWRNVVPALLRMDLAMQLTAGFMMFNATAVFGPSWWIAVVAGFVFVLAIVVWTQKKPPGEAA